MTIRFSGILHPNFRKYHRSKARIVQNLISLPSKIFSLWPNVIYIDNLFGAPRRVTHLKDAVIL